MRNRTIRDVDLLTRQDVTGEWIPTGSEWRKREKRAARKITTMFVLLGIVTVAVLIII